MLNQLGIRFTDGRVDPGQRCIRTIEDSPVTDWTQCQDDGRAHTIYRPTDRVAGGA
jgi:hypothetical protein